MRPGKCDVRYTSRNKFVLVVVYKIAFRIDGKKRRLLDTSIPWAFQLRDDLAALAEALEAPDWAACVVADLRCAFRAR